MGRQLLFAIILLCQFYCLSATSCTAATDTTCRDTDFTTTTCTDDVCQCETGYAPAPSGCIKDDKPTISVQGSGSGEALIEASGSFLLICNPGTGGNYKWFKDGTENSVTTSVLTITTDDASGAGSYECQISIGEYESAKSDAQVVTIIAANGEVQSKPVVSGMVDASLVDEAVTLTCINAPYKETGLSFKWYKDNVEIGSETVQTYTLTLDSDAFAKGYKCEIVIAGATFANAQSDAVASPSAAATEISGVSIDQTGPIIVFKGGSLILNCLIDDENFNPAGVTFSWFRGSTDLSQATASLVLSGLTTTNSGDYTCKGTVDTDDKTSAIVTVSVQDVATAVSITSEGSTPVEGGCTYLQCDLAYSDISDFSYVWKLDAVVIYNQNDRTLQYCPPDGAEGSLTCAASSKGGLTADSTASVIAAPEAITAKTPSISDNKPAGDAYGLGETYTVTCDPGSFVTPGLTYVWTEDSSPKAETGNTISITLTTAAQKEVKCKAKFDNAESNEDTLTIAAADIKSIISVEVGVNALAGTDLTLGTTLTPLDTKEVTLKCTVTKAQSATGTVTYKWFDGSTEKTGETADTYTVTASSTPQVIKCEATLGSEAQESTTITVTAGTTLALEGLSVNADDVAQLSQGQEYTFFCETEFFSDETVFEWKVDSNVQSGETKIIFTTSSLAQGKYDVECKASDGGQDDSGTLSVTVGAAGKSCTTVADCEGNSAYTGVCTDDRCVCAENYTPSGAACVADSDDNDSTKAMTSITVLFIGFLLAKLM